MIYSKIMRKTKSEFVTKIIIFIYLLYMLIIICFRLQKVPT